MTLCAGDCRPHGPQGKNIKLCSPLLKAKPDISQTSLIISPQNRPIDYLVMRFVVGIIVVLAAVVNATSRSSKNICEVMNNTICDFSGNNGCCDDPTVPVDGTMFCTGSDADPSHLRWIFTPCVNGQVCLRPDEALPYCGWAEGQ